MIRLGFGFAISQALRVVADLEIANLLAAGALYRVMRLLAAEGVFRETAIGRFGLTELGATLCSSGDSSPLELIQMLNREPYLAFAQLGYSVSTGLPAFERVFGKPRFDWLSDHPSEAALFQRAMISLGRGSSEAIAEAFDFGSFSRVADIGGGHGQLLSAILSRHPGVAAARSGAGGDLPRTELVAGNFFESVPSGADVYVLRKVIHDWNDEKAAAILRNCRNAMTPHGRVLVVETIVPSGSEPDSVKLVDANMLVVTGGVERTEAEYKAMFAAVGLRLERVIPTARPISILEACRV
jgi:hypothetical protein